MTQTAPDATLPAPTPARRQGPRTGGGQARAAAAADAKAGEAKRAPKAADFKQALVAADRLLGPGPRPRLAIGPAEPVPLPAAAAPRPVVLAARPEPAAARPAYDPAAPFFFPEATPGAVGGNWAWARAAVAREQGRAAPATALAAAAPPRPRAPAPALAAAPAPAADPDAAFRQRIAEAERSAEHPGGGYALRNAGSGALGRYQLMQTALRDIGWRDGSGWTEAAARHGVTSEEAFLASPAAQEAAMGRYLDRVGTQLDRNGAAARAGATVTGLDGEAVPVTRAGLVAAAHRRGAATVARYLAHRTASPEAAPLPEHREAFGAVERRLRDFAAPSVQAGTAGGGGRRAG